MEVFAWIATNGRGLMASFPVEEQAREFVGTVEGISVVPLYSQATVDTLRAQLEAAERYKVVLEEWHAKTDWVQETVQPRELGRHRADILRARIEAAEAGNHRRSDSEPTWAELTQHWKARAEAAEANAARYEWLRDSQRLVEASASARHRTFYIGVSAGAAWGISGEHADTAIDAAIAHTKEQQA